MQAAEKKTSHSDEPRITINGHALTVGQAMTVRNAVESFAATLADGLGDDDHGHAMAAAYKARIREIREFIFNARTRTG